MDVIKELKIKIQSQNLWAKEVSLKRNEYLIRAGSIERYLYFVEEGTIRAFIEDEGEEQAIRFAYPNSIITALDSFFSGKPTRFNLQAIKQCKLRAVEKEAFNNLMGSNEENSKLFLQMLQALVVQQMDREIDILTSLPTERYKRVLERSPHLFQEIPNKHIASYLRMTPETLSRIKKS
ncbi:MAG: Crp/Fnr family transcriptional regulator [Cyclobacteriaceae bacterium]|nr:Crp/Fnr family transcriptional regulator [Cyclobacteriaceae bacterium]